MTLYEKKLFKIKLNIDRLTLKGKDNYMEFSKYVDDLILKGDYNSLIESLSYYYAIDITTFENTGDMKRLTWKEICFQTSSSFLIKLKKIYDKKNVYQLSFDIFSTSDNTPLGRIYEREVYTTDTSYYIKNKQFERIMGSQKSYLEVYKVDISSPTGFATASKFEYNDNNLSEDLNLLTRYTQAIDYLNS
jgi:hypothetical protein